MQILSSIRPAVVAAFPVPASKGDTVVLSADGRLYTYDGSAWIAAGGGGSTTLYSASIPFSGDTVLRATITNANVTSGSKIHGTIRRPNVASEFEDRGWVYIANVVLITAGSFDLRVSALLDDGLSAMRAPPQETIEFHYVVG